MTTQVRRPRPMGVVALSLVPLLVLSLAVPAACARRAAPPPAAASPGRLMPPGALQSLPSREPDRRVAYGDDSSQYGELRVPTGPGPHPVAVLVHGGCFKAA